MQTQLWITQQEKLLQEIEIFLKKIFCPTKNDNCSCPDCKKLTTNQHSHVLSISPQKSYYVLEDIEIIFQKTSFSLNNTEKFYFIIHKAETLGKSCSNTLLKLLEEPPMGYNFILLTNNISAILPTIRSRCIIKSFVSTNENKLHPLLNYFIDKKKLDDPITFSSELKSMNISENETLFLLNELFGYFSKKLIISYKNNDERTYLEKMLTHIKRVMKTPPQPGGSQLLWKYLYLSCPR